MASRKFMKIIILYEQNAKEEGKIRDFAICIIPKLCFFDIFWPAQHKEPTCLKTCHICIHSEDIQDRDWIVATPQTYLVTVN